MTKRILIILMLVFIIAAIGNTVLAERGPVLGEGWKNPLLYERTRLLPFAPESIDNMSQQEYVFRLVMPNLILLIFLPIVFEIVFAYLLGIRKLKPIVLWSTLLNIVMISILISCIHFTKGIYRLPLLMMIITACILKYIKYKKAYENKYTEKKIKSYVITIGLVELIYINIMLLVYGFNGLA